MIIEHRLDLAIGLPDDDHIALLQRPILHQQRGRHASLLIHGRFNHRALGFAIGVGS